jgi:hypothetical protein
VVTTAVHEITVAGSSNREGWVMKYGFWIIILIIMGFTGFLMGYSLPPFIEAGIIGGGPNKVKAGAQLDTKTQDYYKNLLKDE